MRYRYTWSDRLHTKQDFSHVIRDGRRFSASGLILWVYHDASAQHGPRVGFAIPKAFGRAVDRNRIKRQLREIFRLNKAFVAQGTDLVFAARAMSTPMPYAVLESLVKTLWTKASIFPASSAS